MDILDHWRGVFRQDKVDRHIGYKNTSRQKQVHKNKIISKAGRYHTTGLTEQLDTAMTSAKKMPERIHREWRTYVNNLRAWMAITGA